MVFFIHTELRCTVNHTSNVLIFHTNFFWGISHFKKNSVRYYHNVFSRHVKYPSLVPYFKETSIFWTDFRKYAIKFHEKLSSGSRGAPCEREGEWTDRRGEASSYILKFLSKSLKITLNFWTWRRVESRTGQALLDLVKMQWINEIIYVMEQPVHIPGND